METVGQQKLWTFLKDSKKAEVASCTDIRKGTANSVADYLELSSKIAELQFMNKDTVLLFRGQNADHKNRQNNTSLKPTIFRDFIGRNPPKWGLKQRYKRLDQAEILLIEKYKNEPFVGYDLLKRQRILRWSILQHYEVCATPLLDVTHSLRIASSFASHGAKDEAFVFVLGVPNISGALTASAEACLQIVRLSSVCPPTAIRPHLQEGYLLGEYPELDNFDQKEHYAFYEIDFGRRLVAKFRFNPTVFWKASRGVFPKVSKKALYPNSGDKIFSLMNEIKNEVENSELPA